ncbi:unnamed protein product, partial [Effrenium voratum]
MARQAAALPRILVSLGRSRQWAEALRRLGPAKDLGPEALQRLNAGISACRLGAAWQAALALFRHLLHEGPAPDQFTFSSAILAACAKESSRWQLALAMMEAMPSYRVAPNAAVCNAAIIGLEHAGRWQEALHLFGAMDTIRVAANLISLNATIAACSSSSRWQPALALLKAAPESLGRSTVSFNTAITACGRAAQWRRSLVLLEELRVLVPFDSGQGRGVISLS